MKHLIYLLFILAFLSACQEDETGFDTGIQASDITFKPIAGGAIMYYKLPVNDNVFRLKVRYKDVQGNEITRMGSYACDSLEISGFDEGQDGISAMVTLCNRQDEESAPVEVSFKTLDSGPVAFFRTAKVEPYWNGFTVSYAGEPNAKGMAHVLLTGTDPLTHEPDTLLVESFPITEGSDTLYFSLQNPNPANTVVIRTEDYRGYRVKQQVWKDVESYGIEKLKLAASDFQAPEGLVINKYMMGAEYLFDGDTKGEKAFLLATSSEHFCTFMAGPHAKGKPFILDLHEEETPAYVRIYCMLFVRYFYLPMSKYWNRVYVNKVPSAVSIYGSNDKDDDASWVKLGNYEEPNDGPMESRWCYRCPMVSNSTLLTKAEDIQAADPCYITITLPADNVSWRYLKVVVDELFKEPPFEANNDLGYVTFNELEVYVKAK